MTNPATPAQPSPAAAKTDASPQNVTLSPELSAALDAWIARQTEPRPSRAQAIGQLLAEPLSVRDAGSIAPEELNASNDE